MKRIFQLALILAAVCSTLTTLAAPFTYQGQLMSVGQPANGSYDVQAGLFTARNDGAQAGVTLSLSALAVSNGLFTVELDFGSGVFDGTARWLELSVRTNGSGAYTLLTPRQALDAVPYAQYALTPAGPQGVQGPQGLKGDTGAAGTAGAQGPQGLKGDKGDPGVFPTVGPLGINVASPLSSVALQLAPPVGSGDALLVGGNPQGTLMVFGQTADNNGASYIGSIATSGTWGELQLNPHGSTVSVGRAAGANLEVNGAAVVASGLNLDHGDANNGTLSPGLVLGNGSGEGIASRRTPGENQWGLDFYTAFQNRMSIANDGTVNIAHTLKAAHLEGDGSNLINVPGTFGYSGTVVAWGRNNDNQTNVPAGLSGVTAIAAGELDTLVLKSDGTVLAWGDDTYGQTNVPAGLSGVTAIAAGVAHALALKSDGTVVAWGVDLSQPTGLSGITAIASGDFHALALRSDGTVVAWGNNSAGQTIVPTALTGVVAIAAGANLCMALKSDGTVVAWGDDGFGQAKVPTGLSGVTAIAAGGYHSLALKQTPAIRNDLLVSGQITAQAFNTTSDRNAKEHFVPVDPQTVLDKVALLPISTWNFKGSPGEAHLGPMAQDFRAAFALGTDERHIATVDADGVALAAIQGLYRQLQGVSQQLEMQRRENAELRKALEKLRVEIHPPSRGKMETK